MAKEFHFSDIVKIFSKYTSKINQHHHNEVNLVPDVKGEMIKALKLRNLIFFLCIIITAASVGATFLFGAIVGGQQIAINGKTKNLEKFSNKIRSYSDLNDFLTIKDQLSNLNSITGDKKVLSRTFNILSALLPTGGDNITISELNVDLSGDYPIFTFDAQANAGRPPYIDYNVLDSFKKSMKYLRYDYGDYVDRYGATIPAYCIIETNTDGAFLSDPEKGLYAYWLINGEGCNPSANQNDNNSSSTNTDKDGSNRIDNYNIENYNNSSVVRIWRTPQYNDWYKANPSNAEPYMSSDGKILNIPHFESACISYSVNTLNDGTLKLNSSNENCLLVPNGDSGITITESSNGRDTFGELVLRFSAIINFNSAVYNFNNSHMLALAPSGRYNVTDSYVQIQAMFGERAKDCTNDDADCNGNGGN